MASVRDQVSSAEWETRVNLAAAYNLVAMYGWDDLIFTHISARVPGPEAHFLINPYDGKPLEIALKKLSVENLSNLSPHPLYVFMHYSHPTLLQRLQALKT